MSNDEARHELAEVMALVEEQMADIAAVQKKQRAVRASASAADGAVEVTVNALGQLVKVTIDDSYLEDHEFEELGEHIAEAASAAVEDAGRQVAALMAPIAERRKAFPSLSDIAEGAPDLRDLLQPVLDVAADPVADARGDGAVEGGGFPKVRS